MPGEIIVDSFAGGGGASLGIELALGRSPDIAINHDRDALAIHLANHPGSLHYREDVWQVDPVKACAGRPVGLMWLSPDCKHFSKAKGGKPVSKKIRGLAWVAVRWAKAVKPRIIILENVEEFQTWGPLDNVTGRPCPERKGLTFRRFVGRLRNLGYAVEWRELRACDYGAPTIRKRLFLIARSDGQPIVWPTPTHGPHRALPWRTAAECIDWSIPCPSIFARKKPLAENTLKRIARGIRRYVIESPRPFIVPMQHDNRPVSVDEPLQTITTQGNKFNVVTPFIVGIDNASNAGRDAWASGAPLTTVTAEARHALVAPFLKPRYGEDPDPSRRGGLGQAPRVRSLEGPMPVIVPTSNGGDLVAAFLAKHYGDTGQRPGSELTEPVSTITACDHNALVASTLVNLRGTEDSQLHGRAVTEPMPTISAQGNHAAEVRAFLVSYYGTEQRTGDLFQPAPTVTAKDRLALVTVNGAEYIIADIGMRMLVPRELARAQSFPDSYLIEWGIDPDTGARRPMTKTAQVKMIGNSVCPVLAEALIRANVGAELEVQAA